jgi:hypothetical protein
MEASELKHIVEGVKEKGGKVADYKESRINEHRYT